MITDHAWSMAAKCETEARRLSQIKHDAAFDFAGVYTLEDAVDVVERFGPRHGLHLSSSGEVQRLLQIEARTDDRAAHRDPVEHHVEDVEREVARRQAVQGNCPTPTDHAQSLLEGDRRDSRHQYAVSAADLLLQKLGRIMMMCIHRDLGTEGLRERQFDVIDIHGRDIQPHRDRILDGKMPQAADARDHDPVPGPRIGHLETFINRHAGAQDRSNLDPRRDMADVVRINNKTDM